MGKLIGAIDQGTTSTRAILFDEGGRIVSVGQKEHRQIYPQPGWVEHDAEEIWANTAAVVAEALARARVTSADLAAVGSPLLAKWRGVPRRTTYSATPRNSAHSGPYAIRCCA